MLKDNVAVIGLGLGGETVGLEFQKRNYPTYLINGSVQDNKTLSGAKNLMILEGYDGLAGDRSLALNALKQNKDIILKLREIKQKIILCIASGGGSTGSGTIPFICDLIIRPDNIVVPVLLMPRADEPIQKRLNAYNVAKEIMETDGIGAVMFVNNEAYQELKKINEILNETNSLIKESLILSKDAGISSEKSTEILLAGLNGFQLASDKASKISDVINKIDLLTASSAEGLGESLTKVASMANLNGVSLEKTVAMLATIKDSTQAADATVGTSLKSIFSRINSIKAGKFVDSESGEALNDVEKVLNKVGISMRDVNGQFLDTDDILEKVADKWKTLDKKSQKGVMTALGGTHQANATAALLDNYDKVLSLTKEAENSSGSSLKKFEENYLPSLEAKTNSLKASLEGLSTSLISDDLYSGFLDGAKAITDFIDKTNLLKGALAGLGTSGGLFVFQQIGMFIKEAVSELSNLGNAMNVLKIGNLGTNEFQKLLTLTQGLSDSQMELVLSSTESNPFNTFIEEAV